jgi:AcrR family transcriptional regulator
MGRPAKDKKKIEQALKLYDERSMNSMSISDIVKLTGVPKSTVYAELKKAQS